MPKKCWYAIHPPECPGDTPKCDGWYNYQSLRIEDRIAFWRQRDEEGVSRSIGETEILPTMLLLEAESELRWLRGELAAFDNVSYQDIKNLEKENEALKKTIAEANANAPYALTDALTLLALRVNERDHWMKKSDKLIERVAELETELEKKNKK